jgi:hypothetical protein
LYIDQRAALETAQLAELEAPPRVFLTSHGASSPKRGLYLAQMGKQVLARTAMMMAAVTACHRRRVKVDGEDVSHLETPAAFEGDGGIVRIGNFGLRQSPVSNLSPSSGRGCFIH